ncbi:leucyl/phenylalanyl-tRNA--protein transferase [Formicincola oecophyllae]|uniref:leucyl/phenylalanyl-tRNA--protein transferase n=1 Tax=Formicincola oecophyllae TaxID=2558361 RepID=UPI0038D23262
MTTATLLAAYRLGAFPMAPDATSDQLHWYMPEQRGIMPLARTPVQRAKPFPARLMRTVRSGRFEVTSNTNFAQVVRACGPSHTQRASDTWISPRIEKLYTALHHQGHAHSLEVWSPLQGGGQRLVGGLYGVALGGAFFGESMFSTERDASKVALVHLVAALNQAGYLLLDTQYVTPHLASLGGVAISRPHYEALLAKALAHEGPAWPAQVGLVALGAALKDLGA